MGPPPETPKRSRPPKIWRETARNKRLATLRGSRWYFRKEKLHSRVLCRPTPNCLTRRPGTWGGSVKTSPSQMNTDLPCKTIPSHSSKCTVTAPLPLAASHCHLHPPGRLPNGPWMLKDSNKHPMLKVTCQGNCCFRTICTDQQSQLYTSCVFQHQYLKNFHSKVE